MRFLSVRCLGWCLALVVTVACSGESLEEPSASGTAGSNTLASGAALTGLSGAAGSERRFTIAVPAGTPQLRVTLSGGSGDADLYIRRGGVASSATNDCASRNSTNDETCTVTSPGSGTWHVTVDAFSSFSGASLLANVSGVSGGTTGTGGGTSNLPPFPVGTIRCPNPPTGYFCLTRNNETTPMTRVHSGVLTGWYHSATYKACIELRGTGLVGYGYGQGYAGSFGPSTGGSLGSWGAPVASTGVITGTADGRYIYVFTDHSDPQLQLMLYDLQLKTFQAFGFKRETCPYSGIRP